MHTPILFTSEWRENGSVDERHSVGVDFAAAVFRNRHAKPLTALTENTDDTS
jgi:hypothetical protein